MNPAIYITTVLCLFTLCAAQPVLRQIQLDQPSVTLTGTLIVEQYYGLPNYGETPDIDEIEKPFILHLSQSVEIVGDTAAAIGADGIGTISTTRVDKIQLAGAFDVEQLKSLIGTRMTVKGRLFPGHTGHHHTEFLLDIRTRKRP